MRKIVLRVIGLVCFMWGLKYLIIDTIPLIKANEVIEFDFLSLLIGILAFVGGLGLLFLTEFGLKTIRYLVGLLVILFGIGSVLLVIFGFITTNQNQSLELFKGGGMLFSIALIIFVVTIFLTRPETEEILGITDDEEKPEAEVVAREEAT